MRQEFAARRAAARKRLDAIDPARDPARGGRLDDPYRRDFFRAVYDLAEGDAACIPWADLKPHPLLADWLATCCLGRDKLPSPLWGGAGGGGRVTSQGFPTLHPNPPPQGGREQPSPCLTGLRALDVGCGLGDNAEALAARGARTTAFDLSQKAIDWAKQRFPQSTVDYRATDLFDAPKDWRGAFDFVHECYTLQALPSSLLPQAGRALADFLAPGGRLLVIARSRPNPAAPAGPPWPLSRADMDALAANGLALVSIEETAPAGEPAHWRALYRRAA